MFPSLRLRPLALIPGYQHIQDSQLIVRLEGQGNYTNLFLHEQQRPLLVGSTLKWFEDHFPGFMRISKSALINPNYVDKVIKTGPKAIYLKLVDGTILPVSRRRLDQTVRRLEEHFGRHYLWQKNELYALDESGRLSYSPGAYRQSSG